MRRGGFPPPQMTKAQNRLAFTMWLNGCTDEKLSGADVESLARSYGLNPADVSRAITHQRLIRIVAS